MVAPCGKVLVSLLVWLIVYLGLAILMTWVWTLVLHTIGWTCYPHCCEVLQHTICDVRTIGDLILPRLAVSLLHDHQ